MELKKEQINVIVLGNTNAGKSTIVGHLIYKCKRFIDENNIIESQQLRQQQLEEQEEEILCKEVVDWKILDKLREERESGITTIDSCSLCTFESNKFAFTIVDIPGHSNFIKNLITASSQANIAILVIDSTIDGFERDISKEGQTREHALLAYTLGIKTMIVVLNKFDDKTVNYSELRYKEIKEKISKLLKDLNFKIDTIPFIPISGLTGENLKSIGNQSIENNMPWYTGKTLLDTLDDLTLLSNKQLLLIDKPLRLPLQDVYQIGGIGTIPVGRVETGVLKAGMKIMITPGGALTEVKSIEMNQTSVLEAMPGDNVGFNIKGLSDSDMKRGFVVSEAKNNPAKECISFIAQIIITDHPGQIKAGYCPVFDCHTCHFTCKFDTLLELIDGRTNQTLEKNPQFLKKGDCALIKCVPTKPICVEAYSEYPPLGRFACRDENFNVAIGVIKSVEKKN
ncbi:hypothetical protein ABK040_005551 [Willaertia magna]